ncbi:hypothetical protein ACFQL7_09420 [Halocatena marina]|uniref:Uncharacterized protein n=1 Tax=Halocatena marina TaxID=2934937 RepID=A0ABD5YLF0_9EURY
MRPEIVCQRDHRNLAIIRKKRSSRSIVRTSNAECRVRLALPSEASEYAAVSRSSSTTYSGSTTV